MFTDTHAHLAMLTEDNALPPRELAQQCRESGVDTVVTICGNESEINRSFLLQPVFESVGVTVLIAAGIHPHEANSNKSFADTLRTHSDKLIAFGESGLDFHYTFSDEKTQNEVFRIMIALSIEFKKPLIIHARSGEAQALAMLRDEGAIGSVPVVFHCYTGDPDTARRIVDAGCFISLSGIVTFKNAEDIRSVARTVPEDLLLLETDSPFLAPHPFRGKHNTPALISHIYSRVAELRNVSVEQLAHLVSRNSKRFFGYE